MQHSPHFPLFWEEAPLLVGHVYVLPIFEPSKIQRPIVPMKLQIFHGFYWIVQSYQSIFTSEIFNKYYRTLCISFTNRMVWSDNHDLWSNNNRWFRPMWIRAKILTSRHNSIASALHLSSKFRPMRHTADTKRVCLLSILDTRCSSFLVYLQYCKACKSPLVNISSALPKIG